MEKDPQAKIRLMNLHLNNELLSKVSEIISFGNGIIGLFNALGPVPSSVIWMFENLKQEEDFVRSFSILYSLYNHFSQSRVLKNFISRLCV